MNALQATTDKLQQELLQKEIEAKDLEIKAHSKNFLRRPGFLGLVGSVLGIAATVGVSHFNDLYEVRDNKIAAEHSRLEAEKALLEIKIKEFKQLQNIEEEELNNLEEKNETVRAELAEERDALGELRNNISIAKNEIENREDQLADAKKKLEVEQKNVEKLFVVQEQLQLERAREAQKSSELATLAAQTASQATDPVLIEQKQKEAEMLVRQQRELEASIRESRIENRKIQDQFRGIFGEKMAIP